MPLQIVRNDITKMNVDAIVSATDPTLLGDGGVSGAIFRAAGPELAAACRALHGCAEGEARITAGCGLPCRYVIHTVGPRWHGGQHGEQARLVSCYRAALALAEEYGCTSVAFPLIASGNYGYPKDQALTTAVDTIRDFLLEHDMTIYLVIFGREAYRIGSGCLQTSPLILTTAMPPHRSTVGGRACSSRAHRCRSRRRSADRPWRQIPHCSQMRWPSLTRAFRRCCCGRSTSAA